MAAKRCIYFAYGSNLHPLRLQERVPSARVIGVSSLERHLVVYGKRGLDGSGKCTVTPECGIRGRVHGVLFEMAITERRALDAAEGPAYERKVATFHLGGGRLQGFYYEARSLVEDEFLAPFDWYRDLVVAGARFHTLPERHVADLAAVTCQPDPDTIRSARMRALLARMSLF